MSVDTEALRLPAGTRKDGHTVFQTYAIAWMIGRRDPIGDRDRTHRIALREAKLTAEYREGVAKAVRATALIRRIALAAAGTGSTANLAACCA